MLIYYLYIIIVIEFGLLNKYCINVVLYFVALIDSKSDARNKHKEYNIVQ